MEVEAWKCVAFLSMPYLQVEAIILIIFRAIEAVFYNRLKSCLFILIVFVSFRVDIYCYLSPSVIHSVVAQP